MGRPVTRSGMGILGGCDVGQSHRRAVAVSVAPLP